MAASPARRKLVISDAVFSMDGELIDIPALLRCASVMTPCCWWTMPTALACWGRRGAAAWHRPG
jgi:hypothetical protein